MSIPNLGDARNILIFVAVLTILVFVHELGHFITAKRAGIKVLEFGIGFPPRLFAIRRGETEYSINVLPLGGFVKMLGEEDPTEPRSFARQSIPTRIVVLAAGATMNAIFAVVLFTLSFMLPRDTISGQVIVNKVVAGSPAEAAGLQPGDVILQVNEREVRNLADLGYDIRLNLGNDTELRLRRDVYEGRRKMSSDFKNVSVVPRWNYPVGQGPVGIEIGMLTAKPDIEQYPFWEAIPLGLQRSLDVMTITKNELLSTIIRRVAPPVAGPIGIGQLAGQVADQGGFSQMIEFMALLSVNLAVMNILPIPMLDGGRILFVVIELVRRGKRVPPEKEGVVHFIGLMVLLMFLAVVSYQDIVRIINGDSLVR